MFWHTEFVAKTYPWYSLATIFAAKLYPNCIFAMICLHQNVPPVQFRYDLFTPKHTREYVLA